MICENTGSWRTVLQAVIPPPRKLRQEDYCKFEASFIQQELALRRETASKVNSMEVYL